MLRKLLLTLFIAVGCTCGLYAQGGQGTLKGKVSNSETGELLPFANVVLLSSGNQVGGAQTDFDGNYTIKPIPPGTYDLKVTYVGYTTTTLSGVTVTSNRITFRNVEMMEGIEVEEVIITAEAPIIELDNNTNAQTVSREQIKSLAVRSAADIAKTAGNGVFSRDNGSEALNVQGARSGNSITFIDGVKVFGSAALPKEAIEEVSIITSGVSAQYGDVTGGITTITTRGSSPIYFGSIEYLTSGFKMNEDETFGLDNYAFNLLGFSVGGPIITKKDSTGKVIDVPLGFLFSGELNSTLNRRPAAVDLYKPKDEVEDLLHRDPLILDPNATSGEAGVIQRAELLRADDFEKINFQRNVGRKSVNLNLKMDLKTSKNNRLAFGGTFVHRNSHNDVRDIFDAFQLYNYFKNPQQIDNDYRGWIRFTQQFGSDESADGEGSGAALKNAYFSLQVDYSKNTTVVQDENHQDDFFRYGYVGRFEEVTQFSYDNNNFQSVRLDDGNDYIGNFLTAFNDPIAYNFTASDINPVLAAYTTSYYGLFDEIEGNYDSRINVEGGGGIVNGGVIQGDVYNFWSPAGDVNNQFFKDNNDQFRISGSGSADIGNHAIILGFEYEQRVQRSYSIQPRNLWNLGRGIVNTHIDGIDSSNYSIVYNGSIPTITFERLYSDTAKSLFAHNMRIALGLDPNGTDYVDFDSYDIDIYKLEYFSADQVINPANGLNLVYRGFDYTGKRLTNNPSLSDFFNEGVQVGPTFFKTRPVPAYQPIYVAGYIQDKFAFDDLIFRLGVRVDRFDANQPVLKDPFSFFPTRNVAFAKTLMNADQLASLPSNIGDDFVVYVSDVENPGPENIVGYRDGEIFYNAQGEELTDPSILAGSSGQVTPWLEDPTKRDLVNDMNTNSFEDYEPQVNVMPRISFSFPISDQAGFYANYDILTQRPTGSNALQPIDLIYVQAHSRRISNPDLKPQKTISYELGFKQALSRDAGLTISAFYKEQRDMIQVRRIAGAYPENYLTFGNLDFGTVKGFTVNYDMRRVKNVSIRVNYTLQFANGTGSGSLTSLNLINNGQPNLRSIFPYSYDQRHQISTTFDFRYASGKRYNGPKINGKNVLENTGLNVVFIAGSGTPFTARNLRDGNELFRPPTGRILGDLSGARLPWTLRMDARLDKDFVIKWGKKDNAEGQDERKTSSLNVSLQVLNVLNAQNIQAVYGFTGNADDDGYLNSAQFANFISQQTDEQAYRDQYGIKLQDMYNYELPRRVRLGLLMNF